MVKLNPVNPSVRPGCRLGLMRSRGMAALPWGRSLPMAIGLLAIAALSAGATPVEISVSAPGSAPGNTPGSLAPQPKQTAQPGVPPLPEPIPSPISPEQGGIILLTPTSNDNAEGVGQLRPADLTSLAGANWPNSPLLYANWLRGVAIPIYPSPESDSWGWLINGWLVPNGAAPLAIGRDAAFSMVPTDRRVYTFPVLEIRPDGWFRFQYTPAGAAWAHTSQLSLGAVPLTVETWEAYLQGATRIEFRQPGLSQPMRLAPNGTAALQALVGSNSLIQPLDMVGDWLRVRVTQPVQNCTPLPGASTNEGWVRWRDDYQIPLVWFPASGC